MWMKSNVGNKMKKTSLYTYCVLLYHCQLHDSWLELSYNKWPTHYTTRLWNSVVLSDFKRGSIYFLELCDWRVMEAMKCNILLYIPIVDYFLIAGYMRINFNCLTSDQPHTKCPAMKCSILLYIPIKQD
jgi:hypothetical protein